MATNAARRLLTTPTIAEFPEFLKSIESKWRNKLVRRFEREQFAARKDAQQNDALRTRYILSMFPYPSGRLHLGHVRIYTSADILTRYSKLLRKNVRYQADYDHVINPMGFDSFGLPAENAARERNLSPAVWTNSNIRTMKQQLDDLAIQFDWREATSNPSFYRWTQEIFLKLMDKGLVYKSFAQVNWDPVDQTVLADEQVDDEGRSWRSGAKVERRYFRQWFIKVNAFTNSIYQADDVDPETWLDILAIQRHWIGVPCGWLFYIPFDSTSNAAQSNLSNLLPVFTRRPELFLRSNTRLVISDDHWLERVIGISNVGHVRNPFNGENLPISVAHDSSTLPSNTKATLVNAEEPVGEENTDLLREQIVLQAKLNNLGGYYTSDKYRDWLVSRQRFWGTPIPVMNCNECGYHQVPRESLPVTLPHVSNLADKQRTTRGESSDFTIVAPLQELAPADWLNTDCPSCGAPAKRECETFDTLFDSSWYFLRYAAEATKDRPFDPKRAQPTWCYIGGKEHASMHLFYARFITHFLNSIGELKFKEPFSSLLVQGIVKSRTYKLNGKYLTKSEVDALTDKKGLTVEYEKMSKSKGNGVDPQDLIDSYGVDATRFCLMSYANPRTERLWRSNVEEFKEVLSFFRRVTLNVEEYVNIGRALLDKNSKSTVKIVELSKDDMHNKKLLISDTRNKCSLDAMYNIQETNQFRQYISVLHVLTNVLRNNIRNSSVYTKEYAELFATLLVLLNPIVPHLSEELWSHFSLAAINPLRYDTNSQYQISLQAADQPWPMPDACYGRSQCVKPLESVDND